MSENSSKLGKPKEQGGLKNIILLAVEEVGYEST
jgi:hypothetical protein